MLISIWMWILWSNFEIFWYFIYFVNFVHLAIQLIQYFHLNPLLLISTYYIHTDIDVTWTPNGQTINTNFCFYYLQLIHVTTVIIMTLYHLDFININKYSIYLHIISHKIMIIFINQHLSTKSTIFINIYLPSMIILSIWHNITKSNVNTWNKHEQITHKYSLLWWFIFNVNFNYILLHIHSLVILLSIFNI